MINFIKISTFLRHVNTYLLWELSSYQDHFHKKRKSVINLRVWKIIRDRDLASNSRQIIIIKRVEKKFLRLFIIKNRCGQINCFVKLELEIITPIPPPPSRNVDARPITFVIMQAIKLYLLSIYVVYGWTESRQSNLFHAAITPRLAAGVRKHAFVKQRLPRHMLIIKVKRLMWTNVFMFVHRDRKSANNDIAKYHISLDALYTVLVYHLKKSPLDYNFSILLLRIFQKEEGSFIRL